MSISNAFNIALSGLRVTGRMAEIASGNLANALTPGFGSRTLGIVGSTTGGHATGVRSTGVERAQDPDLSAARRIADGDLAGGSAGFEGLRALETSIGTVDDAGSLANMLLAFETALAHLGETPESAQAQETAARAAGGLADKFNRIAADTTALRAAADRDIAATVADVNTALEGLERINRQIRIFAATGRDTAPLIDAREGLVDRVAAAIPVRESHGPDGVLELRTREGITLLDHRARQIEFTPTPVFEPGRGYAGGPVGGLTLSGLDITPVTGGPQAVRGGALAGLFELRDRIAPEFEQRIDSLAADLISRLADPAVDPTLAPGDPGLFTDRGAAFALADTVGIAQRIELSAAVDPDAGGDPARLRDGLNALVPRPASDPTILRALTDALAAGRDATLPPATPGLNGLLSLAGRVSGVAELAASGRVGAETLLAALEHSRATLASEVSAKLAVDSDAELASLIRIEQAYAANAQVIETASRMLEDLQRIR